jgi:plasmid segregation protein ParM
MIMGIDPGNRRTKVVTPHGAYMFESSMGEYRERKLIERYGDDDMVFEYKGKKWFAGTIAQYECEFGGSRKGASKAHEEAKLRILLAIHRYSDDVENDIVVGQPITSHTEEEKKKIIEMLTGEEHRLAVDYGNGFIEKRIVIRNVAVAAEGSSAILCQPEEEQVRIIDIGSGTINYATVLNMRYIDRDSDTARFGMETNKTNDLEALARRICNTALDKWHENDKVLLIGGGAIPLEKEIKKYFPNAKVLKPRHKGTVLDPSFANAVAFYKIGEIHFKNLK